MHLREGPLKRRSSQESYIGRNYLHSDVRIEPGMAGREARALPLSYAVNFSKLLRLVRLDTLESFRKTDNLEIISRANITVE